MEGNSQVGRRVRERLSTWLALSRAPFHTVGVLPFLLGMRMAWRLGGVFRWDIAFWGVAGVILVMLATYYAGEYWDYAEDTLSARQGGSRFSGGSGMVQQGLVSRRTPLWASLASLVLALAVSAILQFVHRTGPWTIPFAALGLAGGFFYSARPVRWVRTGVGELWIAFCYGWLPVAVGNYLQTGDIPPLVHWVATPVGATIFNVILLNEFPDYVADEATGKRNLVVRLGRERAAWVYAAVSGIGGASMGLALAQGVPLAALWLYVPVMVLSAALAVSVLRGDWSDRRTLDRLCGATLVVNLGTTAAIILGFVAGRGTW